MVLEGLTSFLSRRRSLLSYTAGTVGSVYLLAKWSLSRINDVADRSRRDRLEKDKFVLLI